MNFLQLPEKLTYKIGQEIEIKFTGKYPSLFYIKATVVNNIFGLPDDVLTVENGIIYKGLAAITGTVKFDIEQVWGADIDPDKEYICEIVVSEADAIIQPVLNNVEYNTNPISIITENRLVYTPTSFEGFLTKSLKQNFSNNTNQINIVVKSEISQKLKIKTSEGVLSSDTLVFNNITETPSIAFTFDPSVKRGLIYGLKLSYLDKVLTFMLPAGVVLNDENWKDDLIGQLEILAEFEQLECSWVWNNDVLKGTSPHDYYGYKAEWLTSPDVTFSVAYFTEPYSDDVQIITLSLNDNNSWLVKTVQLKLESLYTAKNSVLSLQLFNTDRVINLTPDKSTIDTKSKTKITFSLVSELVDDYTGEFIVMSNTIKNWSDIRLNKSKITIKAGELSDFIEIQSLNKNIGDFNLIFKPNHKNSQNIQFNFSVIANDGIILKESTNDVYSFTTIYKRETVYISIIPNKPVTVTETLDITIGSEVFKRVVEPGSKSIILPYRMIVQGVIELKISIKSKVYNVQAYNEIMPDKLLYIGGKWKLSKSAPVDLILVDNNGVTHQMNEGQLWLPEFEQSVNKISVNTSKSQFVFSQHITSANTIQPVLKMKVVNNKLITETNFIVSQPINFTVNINGEFVTGTIEAGEKTSNIKLATGLNKIVYENNTITRFINM